MRILIYQDANVLSRFPEKIFAFRDSFFSIVIGDNFSLTLEYFTGLYLRDKRKEIEGNKQNSNSIMKNRQDLHPGNSLFAN